MIHNIVQLMQSLKDAERPSGAYSQEQRMRMLKNAMQTNLSHFKYRTIDRFQGLCAADRAVSKEYLREFGRVILPNCILNTDFDDALQYLNDTMLNRVRDRYDFAEVMNQADDRGEYFTCNDCGAIESTDHSNTCYDDYSVCDSCCENYRWSERRDTYISEDDYFDEQEDDSDSEDEDDTYALIGSYHSSKHKLSHIKSEFDKRKTKVYLGLELEMECNEDVSRHDRASQLTEAICFLTDSDDNMQRYAALEHDGSLNNGFEMVTAYTGLDVHRNQLAYFKSPFRGMRSHDTKTCGLHVHICKSDMTLLHASKMILFIHESSNQKLIRSIARRDSSNYAQIKNKKASYEWLKNARTARDPMQHLNSDRYEALNFQNERTVEFRMFKGTLKYDTIMACLEFTYATWFFTREASVSDLTAQKFIEFICKPENKRDTHFLRQYLKAKGFDIPKYGIVKTNPRIESARADFAEV